MEKSVFTAEYQVLLDVLRKTRRRAKITQVQLAQRIGESQSFVSKLERGQIRIDLVQLRTICRALNTNLQSFVTKFERQLGSKT